MLRCPSLRPPCAVLLTDLGRSVCVSAEVWTALLLAATVTDRDKDGGDHSGITHAIIEATSTRATHHGSRRRRAGRGPACLLALPAARAAAAPRPILVVLVVAMVAAVAGRRRLLLELTRLDDATDESAADRRKDGGA